MKLLESWLTCPMVRERREQHVSRLKELKKVKDCLLMKTDSRALHEVIMNDRMVLPPSEGLKLKESSPMLMRKREGR